MKSTFLHLGGIYEAGLTLLPKTATHHRDDYHRDHHREKIHHPTLDRLYKMPRVFQVLPAVIFYFLNRMKPVSKSSIRHRIFRKSGSMQYSFLRAKFSCVHWAAHPEKECFRNCWHQKSSVP